MKRRYSEEQVIQILREAEAAPTRAEACPRAKRRVCRKYGISEWTYYRWRRQYQGLTVSQMRRLKQLGQENERLKRLVAEQMLTNGALKEVMAKRGPYS
ncbi:MAG TPA: transposase [Dehalococcoidia bacterium]|nr:transposase [Dehalococcoidia bacterium]